MKLTPEGCAATLRAPGSTVRLTAPPLGRRTFLKGCLLAPLLTVAAGAQAETLAWRKIAAGVWFLLGSSHGYCNTVAIEMKDYLIIVDANYPGRARELIAQIKALSPKPVRYVFDTHAHRDHAYGNFLWTEAGAKTLAYIGVVEEMDRYEPARWLATKPTRADMRDLPQNDVERPVETFRQSPFILKDSTREVHFSYLGWAHTRGDGFAWLPKERILCTGDVAVNGPHNKLWDAYVANWPRVLNRALALRPLHVLPGHGEAGGPEILTGQRRFLLDLYATVKQQAGEGKTLPQMTLALPPRDQHWIPKSLAQDFSITYSEIEQRKPAGAVPHVWE